MGVYQKMAKFRKTFELPVDIGSNLNLGTFLVVGLYESDFLFQGYEFLF